MSIQQNPNLIKTEFLGEILLARNIVSRAQIKKALQVQKKEKKFIGEILVQLGFVDERDIVIALVIQCHMPYIAVDKYEIDQDIIKIIPKDIAKKYCVIPLDRVGNVLSLVMRDPLDIKARNELQRLTGCCIAPFIGLRSEIEKAIQRWYGEDV